MRAFDPGRPTIVRRAASSLLLLAFVAGALTPTLTPAYGSSTLNQTQSGFVASDSLTTGNTAYWRAGGSANGQPGAKFTFSEDSSGLHIGVQAASNGQWAGYYAVSPNTSAQLFHLTVTDTYTSIPATTPASGFNTGLYVQTSDNTRINYVGCGMTVTAQGYYWTVVNAVGPITGATTITTLYQSPTNAVPLVQDCTVTTNGNNYLKVYIGGSVVVNRSDLTLGMPSPFNAYLEPQTSYAGQTLVGTYTNYYATATENVNVQGAPAGGTAKVVDPTNKVLASAPAAAGGTASIAIGQYQMPIAGSVQVFDSSNILVATSGAKSIWGGDAYQVVASTSSLTVSTQDTTGKAIAGYYTVLFQGASVVATSFSPATFALNDGQAYTVEVQDYGTFVFDHWFDTGSTTRDRAISISSTSQITAVYKDTGGPPPAGQSTVSVSTVNSAGSPITGYYTTLWQNGAQLQSCFSPCSFTLGNGQTYQVAVADYGAEVFNHWNDGTTSRFYTVSVPTTSTTIPLKAFYSP